MLNKVYKKCKQLYIFYREYFKITNLTNVVRIALKQPIAQYTFNADYDLVTKCKVKRLNKNLIRAFVIN